MMTAEKVAGELLDKKAVKLSAEYSFVWASGIKAPIYCDNRKLLSYPETRRNLVNAFAELISEKYPKADVIAGVATGAIAWGVLVAEILEKPFVYVRPQKKMHGLGNQIEGELPTGSSVLVIEDLVSTGGSSLRAVDALREQSAEVLGMLALFSYNLPVADNNFKAASCSITTLSDFDVLLKQAVRDELISETDLKTMINWRNKQSK
jgi:orotate phosphoribosyltransferase